MFFLFVIFSLWPNLLILTLSRTDYIRDVTSTTGTSKGTWKDEVFCPDNTYIFSYNQLQECEFYGTNYIKVLCNDYDRTTLGTEIKSYPSPSVLDGTWQIEKSCSSNDFYQSYYVSKNGLSNNFNELGMNNVRMKCTNDIDFVSPGGGCNADWSTPVACSKGEVFCGYQLRYHDDNPFEDTIAGSDLLFMCCILCKKHNGFYLATSTQSNPSCKACYIYCKTCSDVGVDKCLSCFSEDTLIEGQCVLSQAYEEIVNAFRAESFSDTDPDILKFSSDVPQIKTTSCNGRSWIGGYNVFGKDNKLSYSLQNKAPHYKLRIKAIFLKVDEWALNSGKIMVDGVAQSIPDLTNIAEKSGNLFFGNMCGGLGSEDIINVDYLMDLKTNEASVISFTSDLVKIASETAWGVRDVIIGIYKCHVSCMTCDGFTDIDCGECYPQASKVNGRCTCNDNYFEEVTSACTNYPCTICQPCFPGCKKCTSSAANACISCVSGYFYSSNMCVTQCVIPLWGDSYTQTCVSSCHSYQYPDLTSRKCLNCDVKCATCSSATICITCAPNLFKNVLINECVVICPDGYYEDATTKNCELCDFDCATCKAGRNICTSCLAIFTKDGDNCLTPPFYSKIDTQLTTVSSFNTHTFSITSLAFNLNPSLCIFDCGPYKILGGRNCFEFESSINKVYSNLKPHYAIRISFYFIKIDVWNENGIFLVIDGIISFSKIFSRIGDPENFICGQTDESEARRIVDLTVTHQKNSAEINIHPNSINPVVASWGISDFSFILLICHESCLTCSGNLASNCKSCETNAALITNRCVCNPGFYAMSSNLCLVTICSICAPCESSCKTCDGQEKFDCLSCESPSFLYNKQCVSSCPSPYVGQLSTARCEASCLNDKEIIDGNRICRGCHVDCLTCTGLLITDCISCKNPSFIILIKESQNLCLQNCGNSYYLSSNTCFKCNENCLECSGSLNTDCLSCKNPSFSILNKESQRLCLENCGSGYFLNSNNCLKCHSDCSECSGPLNTDCISCKDPLFSVLTKELQNLCLANCGSNYYLSSKSCFKCYENCLECKGPLDTDCLSCKNPSFKVLNKESKDVCLQDCGINYFLTSNNCLKCHDDCSVCSGTLNTDCISCRNPSYLILNKESQNLCLENCGNYYYQNSQNCLKCHEKCLTCSGPLITECISCETPSFTVLLKDSQNLCLENCGTGYYQDYKNCLKCSEDCLECNGPLNTDCLSCKNPSFFLLIKDLQNLCLENCGSGYYLNINNCIKCSENCNKCDNIGCLECNPPAILYDGYCDIFCKKDANSNQLYFNNATATCEKNCPINTFPNTETKTCWPCDPKCIKCFGLSIKECISCIDKYFIQSLSCVDSCSSGYFFNESLKKCEKCILKCNICTNSNSCQECENGYLIMKPNDFCTACDQKNNYKEGGYCYECSLNCNLCEGYDKCQNCLTGYYLKSGQCLKQKLIRAQLSYDELIPTRVHLKFDNYWNYGFDILFSKIQLTISNLNLNSYSYVLKKNEIDRTDFLLDFSFTSNITTNMKVNMKLDLPTQDEFYLAISEYELSLKEFYQCAEGNLYNATSRSCYRTILVIPILEYGPNFEELIFSFEPEYNLLLKVVPNNTILSISGLNFTYYFIEKGNIYIIKFVFNQSFTNKPVCNLFITVPPEILYKTDIPYSLQSNVVSKEMRNYYVLDDSAKNLIENTKKTTEQMNSISSTATLTNSFLSFGSSMAISLMMSLEIIRFLKYLDIDYPPNVVEMFKSSLRGEGLIPDFFLDVDKDEKINLPYTFIKYNNSVYPINNNGNILIENILFFFLGIIVLILHNRFESKISTSAITIKLFDFLLYMLVWNFPITYLLGVYLNYIFFSLLSLKFPPSTTLKGQLNLLYSSCMLVILSVLILYFYKKVHLFHAKEKSMENAVLQDKGSLPIDKSQNLMNSNRNNFTTPNSPTYKIIDLDGSNLQKKQISHFEGDMEKKDDITKENLNKNYLIEDISIAPYAREMKESETGLNWFWKRKSTAVNKLVDTLGVPTRVMRKVINNFFDRKSTQIFNAFNTSSNSNYSGLSQKGKFRFDCLKNGLNHSNKGQSCYLMFDVMRQTIIAFMIVLFFENPIAAMGMINFINLIFFVFLVFLQPQKSKMDLIQTILNELCVNLACFASMALAIMERTRNDNPALKFNVGWIMVAANITFLIVFLSRFFVTILLQIASKVIKLYKKWVDKYRNSKLNKFHNNNIVYPLPHEDLIFSPIESKNLEEEKIKEQRKHEENSYK